MWQVPATNHSQANRPRMSLLLPAMQVPLNGGFPLTFSFCQLLAFNKTSSDFVLKLFHFQKLTVALKEVLLWWRLTVRWPKTNFSQKLKSWADIWHFRNDSNIKTAFRWWTPSCSTSTRTPSPQTWRWASLKIFKIFKILAVSKSQNISQEQVQPFLCRQICGTPIWATTRRNLRAMTLPLLIKLRQRRLGGRFLQQTTGWERPAVPLFLEIRANWEQNYQNNSKPLFDILCQEFEENRTSREGQCHCRRSWVSCVLLAFKFSSTFCRPARRTMRFWTGCRSLANTSSSRLNGTRGMVAKRENPEAEDFEEVVESVFLKSSHWTDVHKFYTVYSC